MKTSEVLCHMISRPLATSAFVGLYDFSRSILVGVPLKIQDLHVTLILYEMESLSRPLTDDPGKYRQEMMSRLDILRRNEHYCDLTVVADGKEFSVHKDVLAASSSFFFSLLESNMKESQENTIHLTLEEATACVMEDVFEYMYTGNVTVTNEERAYKLIAVADYLLIPSLKTLAGSFLYDKLTTENCVTIYCFAVKYHSDRLKAKSLQVINSNFTAVMATEAFLSLNGEQVRVLISSDEIVVSSEEEVYKGILNWVSQNKSEREGEFAVLFSQLRISCMSRDFVFTEVVNEHLVTQHNECLKFLLDSMKWIAGDARECERRSPRKCLYIDVIIVCGGRNVLCYIPEYKNWYTFPCTLFEHESHSVVQYRDKIFVIGKSSPAAIDCFIDYRKWIGLKQNTSVLGVANLTVFKGDLYSLSEISYEKCEIHKYHLNYNSWSKITAPKIVKLKEACSVADENHLYLIGGSLPTSSFGFGFSIEENPAVERFDPDNNSWEKVAPTNQTRKKAFGAALNGKIYVAGGVNAERTCEVYNPLTDVWQLIGSFRVARNSGSMVCIDGTLYVLGRENNNQRELSVEVYNPGKNKWKKETSITISYEGHVFKACSARLTRKLISHLPPMETG